MAAREWDLLYRYPGQHVYDGVVFSSVSPQAAIRRAGTFNFRDDDVIVVTYPKSGTTWMQEIAWLILNDCDIAKAKERSLDERSLFIERHAPGKMADLEMETPEGVPRVFKTHLYYRCLEPGLSRSKPRVIVVLRNPKDVLVSQYHFYRMNKGLGNYTGSWAEFFTLFERKELQFGYWPDHVTEWCQHRNEANFLFVNYEDMKRNLVVEVENIASFFNVCLTSEQSCQIVQHTSFEAMKENPMTNKTDWDAYNIDISPFMRKGEIGDWKNYFTASQNAFVDNICQDLRHRLGFKFVFE